MCNWRDFGNTWDFAPPIPREVTIRWQDIEKPVPPISIPGVCEAMEYETALWKDATNTVDELPAFELFEQTTFNAQETETFSHQQTNTVAQQYAWNAMPSLATPNFSGFGAQAFDSLPPLAY